MAHAENESSRLSDVEPSDPCKYCGRCLETHPNTLLSRKKAYSESLLRRRANQNIRLPCDSVLVLTDEKPKPKAIVERLAETANYARHMLMVKAWDDKSVTLKCAEGGNSYRVTHA